jgi:response regulator RpfG family c-di-GMP phosphodiesterase
MNDRETFFDPHLLDIFMANLDRFVAIKTSLTENGEGLVSTSNVMD